MIAFREVVVPIRPSMDTGKPIWWHHHGLKIRIAEQTTQKLVLCGSAAELVVTKLEREDRFLVSWLVSHSRGLQFARGQVVMTSEVLLVAFGITDYSFYYGAAELIKRFGGTNGYQGSFHRYKQFLNIPGPGIGHDGDPNLSLEVTPEIQEAVIRFIEEAQVSSEPHVWRILKGEQVTF